MSHSEQFVDTVYKYYDTSIENGNFNYDFSWNDQRTRFSLSAANGFFIGVMLDQGQLADRAWEGGDHLVKNHFHESENLWENILNTSDEKIHKICTQGFNGKSYAISFQTNKFPIWLKSAAHLMLTEYDGDPRNIWDVSAEKVCLIYERFLKFDGIGDALAKMAQFILVRNHGVAGGKNNQHLMSVKPDIQVRRVLNRAGISPTEKIRGTIYHLDQLKLTRPVDFDAVLWTIGRDFCKKKTPNCIECPIKKSCLEAVKKLTQSLPAGSR